MDFFEKTDNDIELDGSVVVRGYNINMDDFLRFAYELRNSSRQNKVSSIYTLDGYVMDVEDFIAQEQHNIKMHSKEL